MLGVKSLIQNASSGNVGGAIVDGIGVIADAVSMAVPFVPGGVGTAISAVRAANKVDNAVDAAKTVDNAADIGKTSNKLEKLREAATTGQEAHRQIEKELVKKGAQPEVKVKIGDSFVRKDAVMPDGTKVIIKPDTPSAHKSAEKREKLMKDNGHNTKTIYYDPKDPKYQPGSPTYIGAKK